MKDPISLFKKYLFSEIFIYVLLFQLSNQLILNFSEVYIRSAAHNDSLSLLYRLITFLVGLVVSALAYTYVCYKIGKSEGFQEVPRHYNKFIAKNFVEWLITVVRVQIRVFLYTLLLIIPGIIEMIRLSIAPMLVFFSPKMKDENFDPIMASREHVSLKHKAFLPILLLTLLPVGLTIMWGKASFLRPGLDPLYAGLFMLATALLSLFFYSYLVSIYYEYSKGENN